VEICEKTKKGIRLVERELRHTSIYRALYHRRKSKFWFQDRWLARRSASFGGCCAQGGCSSRCCWKDPDPCFEVWGGHCTSACLCRVRRQGKDRPIKEPEDTHTLPYSLRPAEDDEFSRNMINALFWEPGQSSVPLTSVVVPIAGAMVSLFIWRCWNTFYYQALVSRMRVLSPCIECCSLPYYWSRLLPSAHCHRRESSDKPNITQSVAYICFISLSFLRRQRSERNNVLSKCSRPKVGAI
jgi:hypothetical protein